MVSASLSACAVISFGCLQCNLIQEELLASFRSFVEPIKLHMNQLIYLGLGQFLDRLDS